MPKGNNRGGNNRGRNNNPEGRNQYSGGVMEMTRDRPFAAAAVAAAAVGAGVFLWSRRNQISEQISNLSDQIVDWTENMSSSSSSGSGQQFETAGGSSSPNSRPAASGGRSQSEISEEALTLKETGSSGIGGGAGAGGTGA